MIERSITRSVFSSRTWRGIHGYVSMGERPMWMKRCDWDGLHGRGPYQRQFTTASRRFYWRTKVHWFKFRSGGFWDETCREQELYYSVSR